MTANKKKSSSRKIGLWSGASPATKAELQKGLKKLQDLGISPLFDKENLRFAAKPESNSRPYLAGADAQKVRALGKLLTNTKVEDILCVRGGYGTLRLLELLEKIKIPKTPKRLWGFSDQTSLQNYLYLRAAYPWVHSPMLTSNAFSEGNTQEIAPWLDTKSSKQKALKFRLRTLKKSFVPKVLPPRAVILGGNLTCLASIMTHKPQRLPKKKFYLFLEDIAEKNYRLDRVLTMLKQSGFLENCC
jgi:muramoyltetrapeptide carboxypeptidase